MARVRTPQKLHQFIGRSASRHTELTGTLRGYACRHGFIHAERGGEPDLANELLSRLDVLQAADEQVGRQELSRALSEWATILPEHRQRPPVLVARALLLPHEPFPTLFETLWNRCWWQDHPSAADHVTGYLSPPPEGSLIPLAEGWRQQFESANPQQGWWRSLRPPVEDLTVSRQRIDSSGFAANTLVHVEQGRFAALPSFCTTRIVEVLVRDGRVLLVGAETSKNEDPFDEFEASADTRLLAPNLSCAAAIDANTMRLQRTLSGVTVGQWKAVEALHDHYVTPAFDRVGRLGFMISPSRWLVVDGAGQRVGEVRIPRQARFIGHDPVGGFWSQREISSGRILQRHPLGGGVERVARLPEVSAHRDRWRFRRGGSYRARIGEIDDICSEVLFAADGRIVAIDHWEEELLGRKRLLVPRSVIWIIDPMSRIERSIEIDGGVQMARLTPSGRTLVYTRGASAIHGPFELWTVDLTSEAAASCRAVLDTWCQHFVCDETDALVFTSATHVISLSGGTVRNRDDHGDWVHSCAAFDTGILTGADDATIRRWSVQGRCDTVVDTGHRVGWLVASPNGRYAISREFGGHRISLWDLDLLLEAVAFDHRGPLRREGTTGVRALVTDAGTLVAYVQRYIVVWQAQELQPRLVLAAGRLTRLGCVEQAGQVIAIVWETRERLEEFQFWGDGAIDPGQVRWAVVDDGQLPSESFSVDDGQLPSESFSLADGRLIRMRLSHMSRLVDIDMLEQQPAETAPRKQVVGRMWPYQPRLRAPRAPAAQISVSSDRLPSMMKKSFPCDPFTGAAADEEAFEIFYERAIRFASGEASKDFVRLTIQLSYGRGLEATLPLIAPDPGVLERFFESLDLETSWGTERSEPATGEVVVVSATHVYESGSWVALYVRFERPRPASRRKRRSGYGGRLYRTDRPATVTDDDIDADLPP